MHMYMSLWHRVDQGKQQYGCLIVGEGGGWREKVANYVGTEISRPSSTTSTNHCDNQ